MKLWEGSTVYILGGGPSVANTNVELLKGKRVIGVNAAYMDYPWIDACWFGDSGFFDSHRVALAKWGGIKATCAPRVAKVNRKGYLYFHKKGGKLLGICSDNNHVSWNNHSGGSAINLAYHFGAKRIVLIGFDMKQGPEGENNYHKHHKNILKKDGPKPGRYNIFLAAYPRIKQDAEKLGLEILNATLDSALTIFPIVKLEEVV